MNDKSLTNKAIQISMKRALVLSAIMALCSLLAAQTQQGYVKTKGRLANDGSVIAGFRIPNTTIQVKGRTPIISQDNGSFSFPIPSIKFYLQNVQKQGYVLTDPEMLSKQYSYSDNDLIIVMEDLAQQEAERRAIERRISGTLYAQLAARGDEIEAQREHNKITEEKYRELLQKLNQDQDNSKNLIKDMAEHYSRLDFDQIDEFNRKVSEHILNGNFAEAKAMIGAKGNILDRIDNLNNQHESNVQSKIHIEKSGLKDKKDREDIANDCFHRFEIYKMQYQNDSAAYFLELRIGLDTTNVDWLNEAGTFICDYLGDYGKGLSLFRQAARQSEMLYGTKSIPYAASCNNIGQAYGETGNFEEALHWLNESLAIFLELLGQEHNSVAR